MGPSQSSRLLKQIAWELAKYHSHRWSHTFPVRERVSRMGVRMIRHRNARKAVDCPKPLHEWQTYRSSVQLDRKSRMSAMATPSPAAVAMVNFFIIFIRRAFVSLDAGSGSFRWYGATRGSVLLLSCPDSMGNDRPKARRKTDRDQPDGD